MAEENGAISLVISASVIPQHDFPDDICLLPHLLYTTRRKNKTRQVASGELTLSSRNKRK